MPSRAYQEWAGPRRRKLDAIARAHRALRGTGPGVRLAEQQINHAYAMLLTGQFQGFCRDLHSESAGALINSIMPATLRPLIRNEWLLFRKLDRGNPNPGNIGADFERLGLRFWPRVAAHDPRNPQRRALLEELNEWRNAIAHQDLNPANLGGTTVLRLARVRTWRSACHALAGEFDAVMRDYLLGLLGHAPWT